MGLVAAFDGDVAGREAGATVPGVAGVEAAGDDAGAGEVEEILDAHGWGGCGRLDTGGVSDDGN